MNTVLITGATGFIGQHALAALRAGDHRVHAVGSEPGTEKDIQWHAVDLLDESQAKRLLREVRPTHLLHLAWIATPGQFWTSPENARWAAASEALISAFVRNGGRRVVVAGTCAEYDWNTTNTRFAEDAPLAPATPYGKAKLALFRHLERLAEATGVSWGWGRIFWLYGPGEDPQRLAPSIILPLLAGKPANTTDGRQQRDFSHVQDVAGALVTLLHGEVQGAVNVASGEAVAVRTVAEKLAVLCGRPELLRIGAIASPSGQPETIVASIGRLRDEVGWKNAFSLDAGLQSTVQWWRSQDLAGSAGRAAKRSR